MDVEEIGRQVSRPEAATEIYLAALLAVNMDTEAERDCLRRLSAALRLDGRTASRPHQMTGVPL